MRPIIAVSLACLLIAPSAFAQGTKGLPKITPKRTTKLNLNSGHGIRGGIGPMYHPHPLGIMSNLHHYPYHPSGITGGIGTHHPPIGLHYGLGMPHFPMTPYGDPWWQLRERGPFEPADPRDPLGGGDLSALMSPNQLIMRQMLAPQELALLGLTNDDFLFSYLLRGPTGGSLLNLGMPSFPRGMMSPYGGVPQPRILPGGSRSFGGMPQFAPYYPPGFLPSSGRFSIGPATAGRFFSRPANLGAPVFPFLPSSGIGVPRGTIPYYGVPKRPRTVGEASQPAPKTLAAKPLTGEIRQLLRSFEKDLAGVVAAARGQDQTKLDAAIGKVLSTTDLPDSLRSDLKELDAAAKEIAASQWLANASAWAAKREREHAGRDPKGLAGLGIASSVNAFVAPATADHVECRAFELKVLTADIERVQKLVARLADDPPAKKDDTATAAAVEKLLGRSLSGVETLVWLHMRADQRSAEEVAAELRKTR